jgi:hypothetical protein
MDNELKQVVDDSFILIDFLAGEDKLIDTISSFSNPRIDKAINFIRNSQNLPDHYKDELLQNSWKIVYKPGIEPPTPYTFISEKYLGPVALNTYKRIKDIFVEFLEPTKPYRNLILYPYIGFGKSYLSALITVYIAIHLALMRNPKKFFGLNPATVLAQLYVSYNLKKSAELLLEPTLNMLDASPIFERVRSQEAMIKKDIEYQQASYVDKIYWTTASRTSSAKTSAISFSNGHSIKLSSSVSSLLGLTIISGVLSELAFFREAGKSDDYIMRMYTDMKSRVFRSVKGNYFGRTILDSSPNDITSPIDRYCWYEAHKVDSNFVVKGASWDWDKDAYKHVDEKFYVFLGDNSEPPRVLETAEVESIDPTLRLEIPKEPILYNIFQENCIKALKDYAGIPQGALNRLIPDFRKIEDMFTDGLRNIYSYISTDESEVPEGLIWNKIKDIFFIQTEKGYQYYYKPYLPRVISIDQSYSEDTTGISMAHVELIKDPVTEGFTTMYVIDFTIPIVRTAGLMNLDAIKYFMLDLVFKGNLAIQKISFDRFESQGSAQFLKRMINPDILEFISVDKKLEPYFNLIQILQQGRIRCGKNIFLKNNLKSLQLIKRKGTGSLKVEHSIGDTGNIYGDLNWDTSLVGFNAKDISDSVCAAVELCTMYLLDSNVDIFNEEKLNYSYEDKKRDMIQKLHEVGLTV